MRSLHATNVYHYDHVIQAMSQVFDEVGLIRRTEFTPESLRRMKSIGLPSSLVSLVSRRIRTTTFIPNKETSLGLAQVVHPLNARLGRRVSKFEYRLIASQFARKVQRNSKKYEVLHFVEGLGYRSLRTNTIDITICERRALHHAEYEVEVSPLLGFPATKRVDPIGDILNYEYENSDYILVYSEVAKNSFLDRGYSKDKVKVVPLPVGPQLARITRARSMHTIAYVGRGDIFRGLDIAVAAIQAMPEPYHLVVAGVLTNDVKQWLSAQPRTRYLGNLNREQLRELYSTASALVAPSRESFGLSVIEASFHRLPIVCSNMTGSAEYLPRSIVSVVQGWDPNNWASALEDAVQNRGELNLRVDTDVEGALSSLSTEAVTLLLANQYRQMLTPRVALDANRI